jgi:hypothetical protein
MIPSTSSESVGQMNGSGTALESRCSLSHPTACGMSPGDPCYGKRRVLVVESNHKPRNVDNIGYHQNLDVIPVNPRRARPPWMPVSKPMHQRRASIGKHLPIKMWHK